MLKLANIQHYFGQSYILRGVSLQVEPGNCLCLMGRNGVGKTTLMQCAMGLLQPREGETWFAQNNLSHTGPEARAAAGLGYVPQGRMIFPRLTVTENLMVAARGQYDHELALVYELFPVLKDMGQRCGGDLSGGQQQQLAIGRALMLRPQVLILDEPCEGIQPNLVKQIGEVIRHLVSERNMAVLLVEQKVPFARSVADRFALMERGQIVANGAMSELTDQLIEEHLRI